MSINNNALETITKLGLTLLEAKVYLALCKYEKLSAKQITKLTNIAQPDVYRVAKSLQEKGLVEKQIQKPSAYKAVPFEIGTTFLLERKKTEYKILQKKIKKLSSQYSLHNNLPPKHESHFLMIPKRENVVKRIAEAIERAEKKIDLSLTWKRFYKGMTSAFHESVEKAWERGVEFRIVLEIPHEKVAQEEATGFCRKSPMCNIRFLPDRPKTVMGIYDGEEAFIVVHPKEGLFESPILWSNNPSLITAVQEYFNLLWNVSLKNIKQNSTTKISEIAKP